MKKLTRPIFGLHFMSNNSVVIDTTHGLLQFPHMTMQFQNASTEKTAKHQLAITDDALMKPLRTTKTVTAFVKHPSEWNITRTVTPLDKFTETASLLNSHSITTSIEKRRAVSVILTMESPYLIEKNTQIAEFSIVTPEQSKYNKPVNKPSFSMIRQGILT